MAVGQAEARTTYRRKILRIDDSAAVSSRRRPTTVVIRRCEKDRGSFPLSAPRCFSVRIPSQIREREKERANAPRFVPTPLPRKTPSRDAPTRERSAVRETTTNRRNGRKRNNNVSPCDPPSSPLAIHHDAATKQSSSRGGLPVALRFNVRSVIDATGGIVTQVVTRMIMPEMSNC